MIVGAQLYTLREWMTTEQQVVDTHSVAERSGT